MRVAEEVNIGICVVISLTVMNLIEKSKLGALITLSIKQHTFSVQTRTPGSSNPPPAPPPACTNILIHLALRRVLGAGEVPLQLLLRWLMGHCDVLRDPTVGKPSGKNEHYNITVKERS